MEVKKKLNNNDPLQIKNKLLEYYEESKENIDFKSKLIFSLIQSIKEDNTQFFSKSMSNIIIIYLIFNIFIVLKFLENKKNDINSDKGTDIVLDDKIDNNILNNTLISIKNIVQKIIDENKKSLNFDGNDKLLKTDNNNITKGTESDINKSNNNFYSNVHIKTITNINEVISNNINNNTDNNVNKSNDKINKSNDSINIYENMNKNDKAQKNILYNQFVQNKNKNKKKKIFINNKINKDFNLILTDRRKKNKTFVSNKKSDKREKKQKDKDKDISFISSTTEIKEEKERSFLNTPVKKGPRARISIKDYIKKTKSNLNQNILNSNKKRVITNENDNYKNNNVTMDEIKRNLTKENTKKINKVHFQKKVVNKNLNNEKIIIALETPRTSSKDIRHSMPENGINKLRNIADNLNLGQNSLNSNTSQEKRKNKSLSRKSTKKVLNCLSERERSFYILAKSPILRLSERLFFGRSTPGIREIFTIPDLLNINEKYLNNKKKELEEKIQECNRKIGSTFTASKTAEILFNLILEKDEDEFKQLFHYSESDKKYYYTYIKIIYLLFDFEFEKIELKQLNSKLYALMLKKGFNSIKDYLYHIYIKKKEKINIVYKIDKINEVLRTTPDLIKNKSRYKFCRFILFTSFLIGEIIKYGNDIKNSVNLNLKTKNFIDIINKKIESYRKNKLLISLKSNKS